MGLFGRKKQQAPVPAPVHAPTVVPLTNGEAAKTARGVSFQDDGSIRLSLHSIPEAKLAVKQLKLRKQEIALEKKAVTAKMAEVRASRQIALGNRSSMVRGGGKLGSFVRTTQRFERDSERARHAATMAPMERQKAVIERRLLNVQAAITAAQEYILENNES